MRRQSEPGHLPSLVFVGVVRPAAGVDPALGVFRIGSFFDLPDVEVAISIAIGGRVDGFAFTFAFAFTLAFAFAFTLAFANVGGGFFAVAVVLAVVTSCESKGREQNEKSLKLHGNLSVWGVQTTGSLHAITQKGQSRKPVGRSHGKSVKLVWPATQNPELDRLTMLMDHLAPADLADSAGVPRGDLTRFKVLT